MTTLTIAHASPQDVLNDAVVAYLGYGTARSPQRNVRALECFADDSTVIRETRDVIRAVLAYDVDPSSPDDDAAVAAYARELFPWLADDAVDAIVWNYRLGWR